MMDDIGRGQAIETLKACTGLENDGDCITVLEKHEWDVMDPPQFPGEAAASNMNSLPERDFLFNVACGDRNFTLTLPCGLHLGDLREQVRGRTEIPNDNMKIIAVLRDDSSLMLDMPDTEPLSRINFQDVTDLVVSQRYPTSHHPAASKLPARTSADVDEEMPPPMFERSVTQQLGDKYTIVFHCPRAAPDTDLRFSEDFDAFTTISEIQKFAQMYTSIAPEDQLWTGIDLPDDNTTTLMAVGLSPSESNELRIESRFQMPHALNGYATAAAASAIEPPPVVPCLPSSSSAHYSPPPPYHRDRKGSPPKVDVHHFSSRATTSKQPVTPEQPINLQDALRDDDGEFDDTVWTDSDEISKCRNRLAPLMTEEAGEDMARGVQQFAQNFAVRYGPLHPHFFLGSLEAALQFTLHGAAHQRRVLAIYVHDDKSVLTNVFCGQVLCSPGVVEYISHNFVVWPWDITCDLNRDRLLTTLESQLHSEHFSETLRTLPSEFLPAVFFVTRPRASFELASFVKGDVTDNELMTQLIQTSDIFGEQMRVLSSEEDARAERNAEKDRQDAAYQESLRQDREKRDQEREVLRKDQEEKAAAQREAERLERERITREELKEKALKSLREEPSESTHKDLVTNIRIRLPAALHVDGSAHLTRRFYVEDRVELLIDFITAKGFHLEDYKLLRSYPRIDLTEVEKRSKTFKELKLFPSDTLILEERS